MLNLLNVPAKNVIGFEINGAVEENDILKVKRLLDEKAQEGERVNIYTEIRKVDSESLSAMMKDLKTGFEHGGHIDKMAVVTDSTYRKGEAHIRGLLSATEVNTYDPEQKSEALAWIQAA